MKEKVYQAPGYLIELQCYVEANPFPQPSQLRWAKGARAITTTSGRYEKHVFQGAGDYGGRSVCDRDWVGHILEATVPVGVAEQNRGHLNRSLEVY